MVKNNGAIHVFLTSQMSPIHIVDRLEVYYCRLQEPDHPNCETNGVDN